MNGARDPPRSCPSGSARGPARRRELPRLPRAMRRRNKQQLKFNTNQVQVLTSSSRMICLVPTSTFPIWTGFEDFHHPHSCCHVSHQPPRRLCHLPPRAARHYSSQYSILVCSNNLNTCLT